MADEPKRHITIDTLGGIGLRFTEAQWKSLAIEAFHWFKNTDSREFVVVCEGQVVNRSLDDEDADDDDEAEAA